jgi:hypothetical protein
VRVLFGLSLLWNATLKSMPQTTGVVPASFSPFFHGMSMAKSSQNAWPV